MTTTEQPTERVQRLAEQMRQAAAPHPSMTACEEVFAVGYIKSVLADGFISDAKRVAAIRDVVAAVDLANEMHRAELAAELAEIRAAQQEETPQATTTCPSPQCDRLVASPNTYCCTACRGVGGGLHSEGCDARRAERAAQREESTHA